MLPRRHFSRTKCFLIITTFSMGNFLVSPASTHPFPSAVNPPAQAGLTDLPWQPKQAGLTGSESDRLSVRAPACDDIISFNSQLLQWSVSKKETGKGGRERGLSVHARSHTHADTCAVSQALTALLVFLVNMAAVNDTFSQRSLVKPSSV